MNKVRIEIVLEILRRENSITVEDFSDAQDLLEANKDPVPELVKNDHLKRSDLIEATHQYNNSPYVDLDNVTIDVSIDNYFLTLLLIIVLRMDY